MRNKSFLSLGLLLFMLFTEMVDIEQKQKFFHFHNGEILSLAFFFQS